MSGQRRLYEPGDPCQRDEWTGPSPLLCTAESRDAPTGEIIVLGVSGEVDLSTLPVLEATLARSIDSRPAHLVVDLARLRFCSAQGMSVLLGGGVVAAEQDVGYVMCSVPPGVARLWTLFWPDERPTLYRNAATAVAALSARQAPR